MDSDQIDDDWKQIEQYEQNNKKYRIVVDYKSNFTSLEYKMEVIKMINELNVNQKVGEISIRLNHYNLINEQTIRMMINNYNNVYSISIVDRNDSIDNGIHDSIK